MKLECTQCGAFIAVTSPDAMAECSYCGAMAVVTGFTGQSFLHRPVLSAQDAERLFPAGSVASAVLYWFPYDPADLSRVFTQPYPEMEEYTPPAADRRVWEDDPSGTVIAVDPDLAGGEGVIYHPFWIVLDSASGQGTIVDAVSGIAVTPRGKATEQAEFDPYRSAISSFALSVIPASLVFFLLRDLSVFWAAVFGMAAAIFSPDLFRRISRRSS